MMPSKKISLKTCGKNHAIWFVFLIADSGGNSWCPCKSGEIMLKAVKKYRNDKESIKSSEKGIGRGGVEEQQSGGQQNNL